MKILKSFWLILIVCLFLIYTLVGFLGVPYVITDVLPQKLSKEMKIKTSVKKASFNPFTFKLLLKEPSLYGKGEKPIFSVDKFMADLNILPIFSKTIDFENIDFNSPKLQTIIDKNGQLNLLAFDKNSSKDENSSEKSSWNVQIKTLDIKNGNINFQDQRGEKPINISLKPLNYQAKNLSTKKDEVSSQRLNTKSSKAKELSWNATLSINPFSTQGSLHVKDLDIESFVGYGLDKKSIYPKKAKLDIKLNYKANVQKDGFSLHVDDINLLFNQVEIFDKEDKITSFDKLSLNDFALKLNIEKKDKYLAIQKGKINAKNIIFYNSNLTPLDGNIKDFTASNILLNYNFTKKLKALVSGISLDDVNFSLDNSLAPFDINFDKFAINDTNFSSDGNASFNASSKILSLDKLTLQNQNLQTPSLHVEKFDIKNYLLTKEKIAINDITINEADMKMALDNNKTLDFLKGLKSSNETNESKTDFAYSLNSFNLKNSKFAFMDNSIKNPFSQKISSINLEAKNISSDKKGKIDFILKAKNEDTFNLSTKGNLAQNPLHVKANYDLKYDKMQSIQPYLEKYVNMILTKGRLNSKGNLELKNSNILLKANASLSDFSFDDRDKNKLASWKDLDFKNINFDGKKQNLSIKNIDFKNPKGNLVIAKNGKTNLGKLIPQTKQKPKKTKKSSFNFSLNNFDIKNGNFNIINNSLLQKSTIKITSINANAKPFHLNKPKSTSVKLKATINKTGYINIKGKLTPKDIKIDTNINTSVKNVSIPSLNAYTQKYLGYNIKQGSLTSSVSQKIKKGKLKGDSHTTLEAITLGNQIKSKDAIALPLETGLLLLRNSNGDVELDVPISGDMNDPAFSYGGIIITAITNIFTGVVTAPFSILGNILGIDGKKLKTIDFEPSSQTLVSSEQEKMKQYAKILEKHPNLKLTITGSYDETTDLKSDDNSTKVEKSALITLANNRANTIKNALINEGIGEDKIIIEKPLPSNKKQKQWVGCNVGIKR